MSLDEFMELGLVKGDKIVITMNDNEVDSGIYDCLGSPVIGDNGYHYNYKREAQPAKVVYKKSIETFSKILKDIKSIEKQIDQEFYT